MKLVPMHVILLLLVWAINASEIRPRGGRTFRGTFLRNRGGHAEWRSDTLVKGNVNNVAQSAGSTAAFSISGNRERLGEMQRDQSANSSRGGLTRRVLTSRRPVQPRKPSHAGSIPPNNSPVRPRKPSHAGSIPPNNSPVRPRKSSHTGSIPANNSPVLPRKSSHTGSISPNNSPVLPRKPSHTGSISPNNSPLLPKKPTVTDSISPNNSTILPRKPTVTGSIPLNNSTVLPRKPTVTGSIPLNNSTVLPRKPTVTGSIPLNNSTVLPRKPTVTGSIPLNNSTVLPRKPTVTGSIPLNNSTVLPRKPTVTGSIPLNNSTVLPRKPTVTGSISADHSQVLPKKLTLTGSSVSPNNSPVLPKKNTLTGGSVSPNNSFVLPKKPTLTGGSVSPNNSPVLPKKPTLTGGSVSPNNSPVLPKKTTLTGGSLSPKNSPVLPKKPTVTGNLSADHSSPRPGAQAPPVRFHNGTSSINVLAGFAGRNRVLVISAPRASDGYYRLMTSLLVADVYCEMAERHMQQVVMFHQEGEMAGKVRRITSQGAIKEEPFDSALVPRLMNFLKLEEGKFGMVLLKKTLQVEERYPYPVRLEAMYEAIDQTPMRRLERARQKGFVQRCKAAGVEGQVVESVTAGSKAQVDAMTENKPRGKEEAKPAPRPAPTTKALTSTTTTTTTTTTSKPTKPTTTTTTTHPPTTVSPTTVSPTPALPTTQEPLPDWNPVPQTTAEPYYRPSTKNRQRDSHRANMITYPPVTSDYNTESFFGEYKDKSAGQTDYSHAGGTPTQAYKQKSANGKLPKARKGKKVLSNEHRDEYEAGRPTPSHPEVEVITAKRGKVKHDKAERKKKTERPDKPAKKNKAGKKAAKEGDVNHRNKSPGKKASTHQEEDVVEKPAGKLTDPKRALETFLSYFERRRRLIVITAPNEENRMYGQQKDEYLEQVCDMALRKVSIITIFGPLTNGTMKIDHYQMEHDKPMRGLQHGDLVNHDLIMTFRKELGMTYNDFYMVLTDFDMKVKQQYEVPIAMKAVSDYIDTFSSRIKEMEHQKKHGVTCRKEDKSRSLENFLSRFRWRRRLFVISAPDDEEWTYQQQLYTLTSQACNLGLRHMSVLKLLGMELEDMGGVLELYPINGTASVEREGLSASLVSDIRNYFQISPEYFSMLLVGKDGNVKSWYPSPMWSMSTIYDLVDSMQLRRQEMAIQRSLGMRCPEDEYGHHDGYQDGHHRGYGY